MVRLPMAPAPVANTSGISPATKAMLVIKMGRKRATAAEMADCTMLSPAFLRCTAYSTISTAFLPSKPMSITSAICA